MASRFAVAVLFLAALVGGVGCKAACSGEAEPVAAAPPPTAPAAAAPVKSSLFKKVETATPTGLGTGAVLVIHAQQLDGTPAKGKVAIVRRDSGGRVELPVDHNGRLEAGLAPGEYLVGSPAPDAKDVRGVDVMDRQTVLVVVGGPGEAWPGGGPAAPRIPALEVTLTGVEGKPAGGAWAWLWVDPEKKTEFKAESRANAVGVVQFFDLPPGKIFFGAEHSIDGLIDGQEIERAKDGPTTKATFKLRSAGSIQGRIVDKHGGALADVPISISGPLVVCPRGPLIEATRWQSTDADGAYRFHGLRRGRYRLEAGWRAALPTKRYSFPKRIHPPLEGLGTPPHPPAGKKLGEDVYEMSVMPGEHIGGVAFEEERTASLTGHVVGADGKPAAGAVVEVLFAARTGGGATPSTDPVAVVAAGADGGFRLGGLLAGRAYRVRAALASAVGEVAEAKEGSQDLRITLK